MIHNLLKWCHKQGDQTIIWTSTTMSDFCDVDDSDISFADTESSENEFDDNDDEVKPVHG